MNDETSEHNSPNQTKVYSALHNARRLACNAQDARSDSVKRKVLAVNYRKFFKNEINKQAL